MTATHWLRLGCAISVPYNLLGALGLAGIPAVRALGDLPPAPPGIYATQLALIILLFAGVYVWLAASRAPSRAVVVLCAAGKLQFFAVFVAYWARGEVSSQAVAGAAGDLVLGALFLWWWWVTPTVRA
jgi:hypothetical protein